MHDENECQLIWESSVGKDCSDMIKDFSNILRSQRCLNLRDGISKIKITHSTGVELLRGG